MAENNFTEVTLFVFSGFSDHPELQISLFLIFLFIYLFTVLGNIGLIMLIRIDSQLHTPMYFFLSNLAFIDIFYSSTVTPKSLVDFQYTEINFLCWLLCSNVLLCWFGVQWVFPSGFHGLWSLCSNLQSLAIFCDYVPEGV